MFEQKKQDLMFDGYVHEDFDEDYLSEIRRDDSNESRDGIFEHCRDDSLKDVSESFCYYTIIYDVVVSESSVEVILETLPTLQSTPSMAFEDDLNCFSSPLSEAIYSQSEMQPKYAYPEKHTKSGKKYILSEEGPATKREDSYRPTKLHLSFLTMLENAKRFLELSDDVGSPTRQENITREAEANSYNTMLQMVKSASRPTKSHFFYLDDSPINHAQRNRVERQSVKKLHLSQCYHTSNFSSGQEKRGSLTSYAQKLDRPTKLPHLLHTSKFSKM